MTQLESCAGIDGGSLPALRSHLWLAGADAERTAQSLRCGMRDRSGAWRACLLANCWHGCSPMLAQMRKGLNQVLRDVVTLEVALSRKTEAHVLVRALGNGVLLQLVLTAGTAPGASVAGVLVVLHPQRLHGGRATAGAGRNPVAVNCRLARCTYGFGCVNRTGACATQGGRCVHGATCAANRRVLRRLTLPRLHDVIT